MGLNTDASIRRLKGSQRPILPGQDRAAILSALEDVDMVVFFDEDTPLALIGQLKPDILVKGADYRMEDVVGRVTKKFLPQGIPITASMLAEDGTLPGIEERIEELNRTLMRVDFQPGLTLRKAISLVGGAIGIGGGSGSGSGIGSDSGGRQGGSSGGGGAGGVAAGARRLPRLPPRRRREPRR